MINKYVFIVISLVMTALSCLAITVIAYSINKTPTDMMSAYITSCVISPILTALIMKEG